MNYSKISMRPCNRLIKYRPTFPLLGFLLILGAVPIWNLPQDSAKVASHNAPPMTENVRKHARFGKNHFEILGFAGNTARDHVDLVQALYLVPQRTDETLASPVTINSNRDGTESTNIQGSVAFFDV